MSATTKVSYGRTPFHGYGYLIASAAIMLAAAYAYASLWVGHRLAGLDTTDLGPRIFDGDVAWVPEATVAAVSLGLTLTVLLAVPLVWRAHNANQRPDVDRAAKYMATGKALRPLTAKGREREAKKKHFDCGVLPMLAVNVADKAQIHTGPESTTTIIAGPRTGKSSAFAIPRIAEWTGPLVVTSNKRDLVDDTKAWRERHGERTWVFDPQQIVGVAPTWYWDPIAYVANGSHDQMDIRASALASRFSFATGGGSDSNPYFSQTGEQLVSALILAAAVSGETILAVRKWITNPKSAAPTAALATAGFPHVSDQLHAVQHLNQDQRDGVYGTADTMTRFLAFESIQPWITPGKGRTQFDPSQFVTSHDTLYSLSREGKGSMGPLVTALTVAVCEAAEQIAQDPTSAYSSRGRLNTPLGLVLDEVANVCKWADLPHVYSHYGSKGIILMSFFQSWDQGSAVWGKEGMGALWSASTTRIGGAGIAENAVQESMSTMIGDYVKPSHSSSHSKAGISSSIQGTKDRILSVADLAQMPPSRAVIFEAGYPAALVKLVPWWERPYAKELTATQNGADQ